MNTDMEIKLENYVKRETIQKTKYNLKNVCLHNVKDECEPSTIRTSVVVSIISISLITLTMLK